MDVTTIDILPQGFTVRSPAMEDLRAVYALILASDLADFGEPDYSEHKLSTEWRSIDLESDAWVVLAPDGEFAGYASALHRNHIRVEVEAYVHPEYVGKGIGTYLVRLTEARASEHVSLAPSGSRVLVRNAIKGANRAAFRLLEQEGYAPVRHFERMAIELEQAPLEPEWPAGMTVRPCASERDKRTVFQVVDEAFRDLWDYVPSTFEDWERRRKGEGFDPSLWSLAFHEDEIAGVAVCTHLSQELGWVEELAVRRAWRKRGVGMALLLAAFGEYYRRGRHKVALGVDSESLTGAKRLYERAGMHADRRCAVYQKELRPGTQ